MADMLQQGAAFLAARFKAHASKTVTYKRGANQVVVQATIDRTVFESDNGEGIIDRWESRDYLIDAADLVIATQLTLPLRGDKVVEVLGTATITYEVSAPRDQPVFGYADNYRTKLRIHTQQESQSG